MSSSVSKNDWFLTTAAVLLRLSLAACFLSAVADRFGIWGKPGAPNVGWGTFDAFLAYTGKLLGFLPAGLAFTGGWAATVLEIILALGLLVGWKLRWFAVASSLLLLSFALTITISLGAEPAFSYSVWTAFAASLFLAATQGSQQRVDRTNGEPGS